MHVARNAVMCVPGALVRNGSTFLGLIEGQNMVTLYGGTSVKVSIMKIFDVYYCKVFRASPPWWILCLAKDCGMLQIWG